MDYRAVVTLDYTGTRDGNAYQRLLNALGQADWQYAETSAMYIECDDIQPILFGLEILARAAASPGTISALTLQVQLVGEERPTPAAQNHGQALTNVLNMALPSGATD